MTPTWTPSLLFANSQRHPYQYESQALSESARLGNLKSGAGNGHAWLPSVEKAQVALSDAGTNEIRLIWSVHDDFTPLLQVKDCHQSWQCNFVLSDQIVMDCESRHKLGVAAREVSKQLAILADLEHAAATSLAIAAKKAKKEESTWRDRLWGAQTLGWSQDGRCLDAPVYWSCLGSSARKAAFRSFRLAQFVGRIDNFVTDWAAFQPPKLSCEDDLNPSESMLKILIRLVNVLEDVVDDTKSDYEMYESWSWYRKCIRAIALFFGPF